MNLCLPHRSTLSDNVNYLQEFNDFKSWIDFKIPNLVKAVVIDERLLSWISGLKNSDNFAKAVAHLVEIDYSAMILDESSILDARSQSFINMMD